MFMDRCCVSSACTSLAEPVIRFRKKYDICMSWRNCLFHLADCTVWIVSLVGLQCLNFCVSLDGLLCPNCFVSLDGLQCLNCFFFTWWTALSDLFASLDGLQYLNCFVSLDGLHCPNCFTWWTAVSELLCYCLCYCIYIFVFEEQVLKILSCMWLSLTSN
jgi:hypothetical protein